MSLESPRIRASDSLLSRILIYFVAFFGLIAELWLILVPTRFLPAEDAMILFQFSRNLAHTGIISFIPNGPRAEGATDVAWMVFLSGGIKVGLTAFWLVAITNGICLILLSFCLCYLAGGRRQLLPTVFVMGCFGLMPQIFAAGAGFSVLPFAALLVLLAISFVRQEDALTPLIALLLCLFRPDGIVFAVPILIFALVLFPRRLSRLAFSTCFFVLPGVIYFFARWRYFGHFLPLPFLVKSDTIRFLHLVVISSVYDGLALFLFSLILIGITIKSCAQRGPNWAVFVSYVVVPSVFYFAMRLDQDIGRRFFIYLPVATAVLIAMNWREVRLRKIQTLYLGAALWLILVLRPWVAEAKVFLGDQFDTRQAIALDLSKLPHGTMITTEAGILPFYSQWNAVDPWGLNTPVFATRFFQPSDVGSINPDLIMVHTRGDQECKPGLNWETPYRERTWTHLTRNIISGADPALYDLWILPYGRWHERFLDQSEAGGGDIECWLVLRSSPLSKDMNKIFANHGALKGTR
jgi:hypothetical protein